MDRCADCPPAAISWSRSAFLYEGPVRRALMRLKFGGARSVAEGLAVPMADVLGDRAVREHRLGAGVVTWVPLGRRRKRRRGYDQAQALAVAVARVTRAPTARLLDRVIETAPQARRSAAQRAQALRGSFRVVARPPPRVILVDDVLTSGATASECAGVLRVSGAEEVGVLTAARSLGMGVPARCYNPPGLQPGSVVARGRFPPVVDASRRRNDPRKATVGR